MSPGDTPSVVAWARSPFRWLALERTLPADLAVRLAETFPSDALHEVSTDDAMFHLCETLLVENDVVSPVAARGGLGAWAELIGLVTSPAFRVRLGRQVGRTLAATYLNLRVVEYDPGCWLGPHTDHPVRVATQVIYLNPEWDPSWGGEFQILGSADRRDVVASLVPRFNSSVVIRRSDRSFHAVAPVRRRASATRRAVVVQHSVRPIDR